MAHGGDTSEEIKGVNVTYRKEDSNGLECYDGEPSFADSLIFGRFSESPTSTRTTPTPSVGSGPTLTNSPPSRRTRCNSTTAYIIFVHQGLESQGHPQVQVLCLAGLTWKDPHGRTLDDRRLDVRPHLPPMSRALETVSHLCQDHPFSQAV